MSQVYREAGLWTCPHHHWALLCRQVWRKKWCRFQGNPAWIPDTLWRGMRWDPILLIRLSSILSSSPLNTMGPINITHHRLLLKPHWVVPGLCYGLSMAHPLPDIGELTLGFVFIVVWDVPGCLSSITLLMELVRSFTLSKWHYVAHAQ